MSLKLLMSPLPIYYLELRPDGAFYRPLMFSRERNSTGSNDCFVVVVAVVAVVVWPVHLLGSLLGRLKNVQSCSYT
jgi:hypothetical protein